MTCIPHWRGEVSCVAGIEGTSKQMSGWGENVTWVYRGGKQMVDVISTHQSLLWENGGVVVEVNNTYALFGFYLRDWWSGVWMALRFFKIKSLTATNLCTQLKWLNFWHWDIGLSSKLKNHVLLLTSATTPWRHPRYRVRNHRGLDAVWKCLDCNLTDCLVKCLMESDKTFDVRPNKASDQTQTEISHDQTHKPNQASCHFPDDGYEGYYPQG